MSTPTVFISYSHRDESWKDRLLPHLRALEHAGVEMKVWHDRKIDGGDKWYPEIQEAMANATVGVLLISADFLGSGFCMKEEVPALIARQEKEGMLLIPVLVRKCPWQTHRWLADRQMLPRDGKCVAIDFPGDHADIVFTDVAETIFAHFAKLSASPETAPTVPAPVQQLARAEAAMISPKPEETVAAQVWPALPEGRVDVSHLPETGSALFGRDEELSLLDKIWAGDDAVPTRVLAFKAQGGVGKSTLINHWLAEMKADHFRGATRVFGWSFYSQGVREQAAPSADTFVAAALRFFGDEAMAASPASAWEKGERLARLVGSERALFVLDGMEPLQSAHPIDRGKLRDPALEALLRGLARQSAGLCIITTRETLADLGKKAGIREHDLEQITPQAGRALLRMARINGTDAELEGLAGRFGPHALAISLVAVYLREQPGRGLEPAEELEKLPGETPVDRVLAGFEQWLGNCAELEALRLLGFFDRPADEGCLRALRGKPVIHGLTDILTEVTEADWHRVLTRLEKLRLLHVRQGDSGKGFVDTHPLIREHFAKQLREQESDAWRAAHRRLYEHLCTSTKEGNQPTLEDLQPLYQAVAHGCQADLQQEACDNVYRDRIYRLHENYATAKLGAFGSEMGAVACFFEMPWSRVSPALTEPARAWLLIVAAFCLRALGRLTEALEPMRAGLKAFVTQKNWKSAATGASNLSELELTLGAVARAVGDAEQSVTYADRGDDAFLRMLNRTTHSDALHRAGRMDEAEMGFRKVEKMQGESQSYYPVLYSILGFRYCDLLLAAPERTAWQIQAAATLLSQGGDLGSAQPDARATGIPSLFESSRAVSQRAAQTLKWATNGNHSLLDIALDHVTLGRAALYSAILSRTVGPPEADVLDVTKRVPVKHFDVSRRELDASVASLRRANHIDYLPIGLLTRAWCSFAEAMEHRFRGQQKEATDCEKRSQEDLDEAWEISERGPMKLHMADIHLYRARLFGRRKGDGGMPKEEMKYPWESVEKDLAEARRLIEECGYWRRKEELEDAERTFLGKTAA